MGEITWKSREQVEEELNNPPLTEVEEIAKQQTDLLFTLMMNGVI